MGYNLEMCRSIKTLFNLEPMATEEEIRASAVQFVRKISGYRKPSGINEMAFDQAVDEVAGTTKKLLKGLKTSAKMTR